LLLGLGGVALLCATLFGIYPFLALNDPAPGGVLVVEGWVPDYALQAAIAEFRSNPYAKLLVTGIPLEQGAPLSEYTNYANLGAAVLVKLGMSTNEVVAIPAPLSERNRTYAMAMRLKEWLRKHRAAPTKVNLITLGPHARRSRLLFEKALGRDYPVGVIAVPAKGYQGRLWWRNSQGVRVVISEVIGYIYARFFFHPREE